MAITLEATNFDAHILGTKSYGFRIYDEYSKAYDNNSESPIFDDIDLLKYALTVDETFSKMMLDYVKKNEQGIIINGQWYDWDEIKDNFEKTT